MLLETASGTVHTSDNWLGVMPILIGIHGPAAHDPDGVHVAVEHERRTSAGPGQPADRLPARLARIGWMGDVHHLDIEADIRHHIGEIIRQVVLFEGVARGAYRIQFHIKDALFLDQAEYLPDVRVVGHLISHFCLSFDPPVQAGKRVSAS